MKIAYNSFSHTFTKWSREKQYLVGIDGEKVQLELLNLSVGV